MPDDQVAGGGRHRPPVEERGASNRGEDPVTVARLVGHAKASMSLDVYGHVLPDETELDYAELLGDARGVLSPALSSSDEIGE